MNKNNKHEFLKTVLLYTAFFAIFIAYMLYIYLKNGKSLIWHTDALYQHIVTLSYFRDLLINFFKTGEISTFTWSIGNGINMYGNLAFYIFGDLFSYFSVFVSADNLEYFFSALIPIRMYFVGFSFLCYCNYKKLNRSSSIIGAIMYTFSAFALFTAVRHPYYCDAFIVLPLVMIGIERIINEDKKVFYTIITAINFIVSFYFAYMISLTVLIYGLALIIKKYRSDGVKKILNKILEVLLYSIIGVLISAVILLPTGIEFINSSRSTAETAYTYSLTYYRSLVNNLLNYGSGTYWTNIGVQSLILISLPVFIRNRKKDYPMFITMVILIIPLFVAGLGSIFSGFSFPNNRYSYILGFIFSYISAVFINDGCVVEKKDVFGILFILAIFLFFNVYFSNTITAQVLTQLLFFVIFCAVILGKKELESIKIHKINLYKLLFVVTFSLGILSITYFRYDDLNGSNHSYVSEFVDKGTFNYITSTSIGSIGDLDDILDYLSDNDDSYYEIANSQSNYRNLSLIKGYNAKIMYYSILPKQYYDISLDLQNVEYGINYGYGEFDSRTKINTLLNTKYYIEAADNTRVEYGYSKVEEYTGESNLYVNDYALDFGTLYTSYISEDEYNSLSALEKESSLLKTVVLKEENIGNMEHDENAISTIKNDDIKEISYKLVDDNNLLNDNKITIDDSNANKIKLDIDNVENSEIYVYFENVTFSPKVLDTKWADSDYRYTITASFNGKTSSKYSLNYVTSPYYINNNDCLLNLGYYDQASGEITISFQYAGTYNLDSIKVYAVSMDDYGDDINNLRRANFDLLEYKNGYLKANASPDEDGILQFSTLYNKGWKVYVDGQEVETFTANKYFLGINITKGEHVIELKYTTPYLKEGAIISAAAILIFVGTIIFTKKKSKL